MPYDIVKRDNKFCVVKQGTDESVGCHPTEGEARKQQRALYANVKDSVPAWEDEMAAVIASVAPTPGSP